MEYKQAIVDADEGLNLRKLPEAASDRIQLIPDRTIINTYPRLEVLNDGGAWVYASLDRQVGWVNTAYVKEYTQPEVKPVEVAENGFTSPFGTAEYPPSNWQRANSRGHAYLLSGKPTVHTGDDLVCRAGPTKGVPVYAMADGTVTFIRQDDHRSTWGNVLVYRFSYLGNTLYARYAHLDQVLVEVGDTLKAGQPVALVGDSGMPGNPHLHFDISAILDDSPLDWPSMAKGTAVATDYVLKNYLDPSAILKSALGQRQTAGGDQYRVLVNSLNVRVGASTATPIIGTLPLGLKIYVAKADNEWFKVVNVDAATYSIAIGGYVYGPLIAPLATNTPPIVVQPPKPPTPAATKNYFGLHIMNNAPRDQVLSFMETLALAGRPVPLVTLLLVGNQTITVDDIRRVSPSTRIVARYYGTGDYQRDWDAATRADGAAYYRDVARGSITEEGRKADAIQLRDINEPGVGRGTNAWWQGVLDEAEADGVKVAVYCFSMGVPALPGDNLATSWFWTDPSTHDVLRRVRDRGHLFTLHQYAQMDQANPPWVDDWTIMRHKRFYAYLPADLKALPLWITEFGDEKLVAKGADQFMRNIQLAYDALRGGPVAGVALWSVGASSYQWEGDRIEPLLPALRDTVMSMRV